MAIAKQSANVRTERWRKTKPSPADHGASPVDGVATATTAELLPRIVLDLHRRVLRLEAIVRRLHAIAVADNLLAKIRNMQ